MGVDHKLKRLTELLKSYGSAVVAFSGGVDSTVLAVLAKRTLGDRSLAVTVSSDMHSREETDRAIKLAKDLRLRHVVIRADLMGNRRFTANPENRCYICKREIFKKLKGLAKKQGIASVMDGTNADDLGVYRPGRRALAELGVKSPLAEAGMGKTGIRQLAREMGLPVWNQPANPCLATRVPYGVTITSAVLKRIEKSESALHRLGFGQCRVRHHGELARLELDPAEFKKALLQKDRIIAALEKAGYKFITLDLAGYRSGCYDPKKKSGKNG